VELTTRAAQGVAVRANATQLQQVLMNLVINARDALPESGGRIDVEVLAGPASGVCASCGAPVEGHFGELRVTDDGAGIGPDAMSRIFDPFFTTKEQGKGTGMGLAVVHGVTHEHGGHILLTSRPGETRFRIVFPEVVTEAQCRTGVEGLGSRGPT
jgi:signal transduction histidine kinase